MSSDTSDYDPPKDYLNEESLYLHRILKGVRHTKPKQLKVDELERDLNESDRSEGPLQGNSLVELMPRTRGLLHT